MSISPNVPSPEESYHYETTGTPRWIAVLFIVLILALVGLAYTGYSTQSRLDATLTKAQDQNKLLAAQLDQANSRMADLKGHVDVTEQKMHMTQAELANARTRAEAIRKEQIASDQKLVEQMSAGFKESSEKINAVATEVGGAKKDIEATRTDLEATKGRLERVTGDMGVMSGLIAHNRDDLEDLRRKGDRNYYEFKITKSKAPQRVGPVQISLNKVDQKKSRYTITVFVDDRSIEKRDKTAGEPVQFYVRGASRQPPYEMVVFDVLRNEITGYLATPKEAAASGTAAPAAPPAPTVTPASAPSKPDSQP
jgi:predicted  nucleic acid-binding Zn-ribbon protein